VPRSLDDTFAFFADAYNLEALTPPWLRFAILTPRPISMKTGTMIDYRLRLHGLPLRWRTQIARWDPGVCFVDTQVRGPYRRWEHTHRFEPLVGSTRIHDRVVYELPLGRLGDIAQRLLVARELERVFDYRAAAVTRILGTTDDHDAQPSPRRPARRSTADPGRP
jgi:hypothetical protein